MELTLDRFDEIWFCDFEFQTVAGELPKPICMVAKEFRSGQTLRIWVDELEGMKCPPFATGPTSLFVAYFAPAEFSCFHALGWELPQYCLDLFVEFRNLTNGKSPLDGAGLLSALIYFGQDALGVNEKQEMRDLAIRGGPFSAQEKVNLLAYCEIDVIALEKLFPFMATRFSLVHALMRGRYMKSAAAIEKNGVPIDMQSLDELRAHWQPVKLNLVEKVDRDFGVFEGQSFKRDKFEAYLIANDLAWPRNENGKLMLDEDTFREMVRAYPQIAPIKEARHAISQLRLEDLSVGRDGRNRTSISPFRATTGRNQPSTSRFIFGPSCWIRGLIQPPPGYSLAYIDWSQQEFGIAAALSGDKQMMMAYLSGDPYLAFAKQAGAVPSDATKRTHTQIRDQFKACVLAVQYGMGAVSLAARINQSVAQARYLLQLHRETYPTFWKWSDSMVCHAMLTSELQTVFGWKVHVGPKANERSLRNFPMQANGAEMLRLACCFMTENDIEVCAPVHDAVMIVAPTVCIHDVVAHAKRLMEDASAIILNGFRLRSDEKIVTHPDRYMDERGQRMWTVVQEILKQNYGGGVA